MKGKLEIRNSKPEIRKIGVNDDYTNRFGGISRLFGAAALDRLRSAHVAVIGVGGVGSWTVEALARSGVGRITMVDLDEICVTNVNRQLHALDGQIGRPKVAALAERIAAIHPGCEVVAHETFFTAKNAGDLLTPELDFVVDAIDEMEQKCLLLAECRERGLSAVTCGGAGGKRDTSAVRVADLVRATNDKLLRTVRKTLRREFGFPRGENVDFGVSAVFSVENAVYPWTDGQVCAGKEPGLGTRLNCDAGLGTATFVTGAFGFAAAAEIVAAISRG